VLISNQEVHMTTYTGALVRERDAQRVTDMLIQRSGLHKIPIDAPAPQGVIVRVVQPPFDKRDRPVQVLVFWEGHDFVPDLLTWTTPMWLEPTYPNATYRADLYGFPILALESDGYGFIYARNPNGEIAATVEIHPDSRKTSNELFRAALHQAIDAWCHEPTRTTAGSEDVMVDTCGICGEAADPNEAMGEFHDPAKPDERSQIAHAQCGIDAGLEPA
jgi:hypothetical protein